MMRSALAVPLLVVATLGAVLGFIVTRQLAPQGAADAARVSVLTLPSSPTPEPTEEPTDEPTDEPDEDEENGGSGTSSGRSGGGSRGGSGGGSGSCPAGCTCESRPPAGVMIVCRGS